MYYFSFGIGCIHHHSISYINTHMGDVHKSPVWLMAPEHKVPRLQILLCNRKVMLNQVPSLLSRSSGYGDSSLSVTPHGQIAAVRIISFATIGLGIGMPQP